MLEDKEITIKKDISLKDEGKNFVIHQISATKLRKLLFKYQDVYKCSTLPDGGMNIQVDSKKKEELYFLMLENIDCKTKADGKPVINKLTENTVDAYIEDVKTMDYLINEFWKLNVGEDMNLIQKSIDNLMGVC